MAPLLVRHVDTSKSLKRQRKRARLVESETGERNSYFKTLDCPLIARMCIVINKSASKSCKLWTSKSLSSKYQTFRFQAELAKEKLSRAPRDERQRNLVLKLVTLSRVIPSKVVFIVCLVLCIMSYRRKIQNTFFFAICKWKEATQ